ncbi:MULTISPECIES: GTPase Era [unclassified Clostridioides]|uniref:GTPase Era n=1 Tax=unclassified Clostridioides TaxID=2635829 RepID=UPI001D0FBE45|nr:GTPase Era [Clostridioides sp. ZZV14-6150]MCC0660179.1 GTPase Era [Clostridioides sp. ZZV14-6154]MCC0667367.1 GTPase Era [Clostridioides sp. ZZV14-6153]MCC0717137.1 GTPase Era [Clostridioides sp. ZZV14-6105]MCC0721022.1 GTPase Era [Clostridioides sp. ZZV14-6104]MCC0725647.1 GTPase Era [Clostridioides sp. ZZV14-6045]MCC0730390.1 GTPase Era [Clostridioides sp. ZZV14-6048]MCC0733268.1 GTPase Era [Clostridioides sp. ZZV14-6009]MCC0737198.1 GTPase Era [Clostridioides sp. ZZV14-5902]MCC074116
MFKSGFVSIVGRPNVGKSTLMNNVVGEKIAIMSDKPQTTRNTIQAVYTDEETQIVFLDTPGIHKPKNKLGEFMVKAATEAFKNVDLILFVVDDSKKIGPGDRKIIEDLKSVKTPIILVVNKIDQLGQKDELFDIIKMYDREGIFKEIVPISALKGQNTDTLIKVIQNYLEEGPKYFPDYMITDQPERVLIAELIREKVLHYLNDEIPHGVAVEIEKMKARNDKEIVDVSAVIYCERDSHKGIIIGKNGRKLKGIGKSARQDIELLLGSQINLQLWVKVKENWRNLQNYINNFGYNDK